ncbi:CPBP family intramembrane glutamic endopeptidase [[Eubacterium] cellulosolvens]
MKVEKRNALTAIGILILILTLISIIDGIVIAFYAITFHLSPEMALIASTKPIIILNEIIFLFAAIIVTFQIFKWEKKDLGLVREKLVPNILVGFGVGAVGYFAVGVFMYLVSFFILIDVPPWFIEMFRTKDLFDLSFLLLITWVLIGPCEEIFFRGFIQESLTRWLGSKNGILAGAIIFGLAHFDPILWYRTIAGFLLGVIYGLVYAKSRNLFSVIVAHSLNDSIAFILTYLFQ